MLSWKYLPVNIPSWPTSLVLPSHCCDHLRLNIVSESQLCSLTLHISSPRLTAFFLCNFPALKVSRLCVTSTYTTYFSVMYYLFNKISSVGIKVKLVWDLFRLSFVAVQKQ